MTPGKQKRMRAEFEPLWPAELKIIEELDTGEITVISEAEFAEPQAEENLTRASYPPGNHDEHPAGKGAGKFAPGPNAPHEVRVRARFLRWLLLGPDGGRSDAPPLHEKGLQIQDALICGEADGSHAVLDLQGCTVDQNFVAFACRFQDEPNLIDARLTGLYLNGSILPGLSADRLLTRSDFQLREAHVTGEIRLLGADLGGNLDCDGAKLENPCGLAVNADGLKTGGNVFLRGAHMIGNAKLVNADIGRSLYCDGARLENPGGEALDAGGGKIGGALFWRSKAAAEGTIDLTEAKIGDICDDPACWPKEQGSILLNRCEYGAFTGTGISAAERIPWLSRDNPEREFRPQPWEHCAKVLRDMGHPEDAREVLIAKERLQRADRLRPDRTPDPLRRDALRLWDRILDATIRFGHRPLRAVRWLLGFWAVASVVYAVAWSEGAFKPNTPFVLRSAEWVRCAKTPEQEVGLAGQEAPVKGLRGPRQTQLDCFLERPEAAGYPRYNSFIYAADVLLPIVEIEQQANWVPDPRHRAGWWAKAAVYFSVLAGWALSLLAVAGFSGLVKSG
ncbi:MAG: hypothetical protein ACFBSD_05045 [Paracoccaceae bacterium]